MVIFFSVGGKGLVMLGGRHIVIRHEFKLICCIYTDHLVLFSLTYINIVPNIGIVIIDKVEKNREMNPF